MGEHRDIYGMNEGEAMGVAKKNQEKTHCDRGHKLLGKPGKRRCPTCHKNYGKKKPVSPPPYGPI